MNPEASLDLEQRLHALLCGGLDPAEAPDLLDRLCRDGDARAALAEMIAVQRAGRTALGCDVDGAAVRRAVGVLTAGVAAREAGAAAGRSWRPARWRRAMRWGARAAALLVVAASAYVAASSHQAVVRMGERLEAIHRSVAVPQVSGAELAMYREMLRHVADQSGQSRPWLLFAGGEGEFGYLPAVGGPSTNGPVLLRCLLLADDGSRRQTLTLVIPGGRPTPLTLPRAALWDGTPLDLDVVARGGWAEVGLTAGDGAAGSAGVRGRVGLGEPPAEVGRFRLRNQPVRLFVQAVPMDGAIG